VGELGERWLDLAQGAQASPYLAPETLVAALPTASQRFIFVDRRGTRYLAESALGPFSVMQPAPRRFEAFQVVAGRWYGLDARGELWRGAFDDRVGSRAPITEYLFDFAIGPNGTGLAVGIPEALWWTDDAGEHWRALDSAPVGATGVSLDGDGGLRLRALLPESASPSRPFRVGDARHGREVEVLLHNEPALTADIRALDEGRAVFVGDRWFELRSRDEGWYLARGRFDEPLELERTRGLDDCQALKLAARAPALFALCQPRGTKVGESLHLRFARPGEKFATVLTLPGNLQQARLSALDQAHVLALGLCQPNASPPATAAPSRRSWTGAKRVSGCPRVPLLVTLDPGVALQPGVAVTQVVTAPGAEFVAPHLAIADDGGAVAFVARSRPTAPWKLYLSTDGGRIFAAHPIDGLPATGAPPATPVIVAAAGKAQRVDERSIQSLNFGEDRSLALVIRKGDAPIVYNFDDRGQLIASSLVPPDVSRVDAVGTRILAVSLTQRNVYQSLDRGASFELIGHLPAAACRNYPACPVICRAAGCLIGERFTRVSWGAPGSGPLDIAGDPELGLSDDEPLTQRVSFRTPLVCETQPTEAFIGNSARTPSVEQVSLGELLWYAPWQDFARASAGMYMLRRGRSTVTTTRAFAGDRGSAGGGTANPADAGLAVGAVEGGLVFLRSGQVPRVGEPLGEAELASWLFERAGWVHARFRDAQTVQNQDFYWLGAGNARRLLPGLLSATRPGVFVAPHEQTDTTHFVTPAFASALDRVPWPVERVRDVHWAKVGDSWQVHALDETGSVLLRASRRARPSSDSAAWTFAARTVANPRFTSSRPVQPARLSWGDSQPSLTLVRANRAKRIETVSAHRLSMGAAIFEPGIGVSLPESLGEPPPTCSPRDRREMSRIILPLLPQAARGVQVLEAGQPARWLVATQAVLFANAKRTCLDAVWAETLPGSPALNAVIGLDQLGHATVFRSRGEQLRATPARCRFDARATPPPEYETRLQARWNLEHLPLGN